MLPPSDAVADTILLPMDLIAEILAWLPVKSILRFTCVCKSWNALISDPPFVKKQFRTTSATDPTRHHVVTAHFGPSPSHGLPINLTDYSLLFLFNSSSSSSCSSSSPSQLNLPYHLSNSYNFSVGSCHGMLCLASYRSSPLLWNPSTRKLKNLPSLRWPDHALMECGFGYDQLSDSYKVVAVFIIYKGVEYNTDVMVHTLGTDSWRELIQKFPANNVPIGISGKFVNGTLNWLCMYMSSLGRVPAIVSLELGTETYQQLLLPDCIAAHTEFRLAIDVLKGCMCILARRNMPAADVWVMKDYGNNESWTKLFSVPCPEEYPVASVPRALWISDEDDEILLKDNSNLAVYNSKSGTSKSHCILKSGLLTFAVVYAESLISP